MESGDVAKSSIFYLTWTTEASINESNMLYDYIKHTKSLGKGSGWIIHILVDYNINIWKYKPLALTTFLQRTCKAKKHDEDFERCQCWR